MLEIKIPETELFDSSKNEFVTVKSQTLTLEHSLRSLAKWESKWHKPFISKTAKTPEELIDYIRCMTLNKNNVQPEVYNCIPESEFQRITAYMEDPMTATTIKEDPNAPKSREIVTAEILYYDMVALNIPFECDKWHLNRLIMLIMVCSEMNKPKKKMGMKEIASRNRSLNALRKQRLKTHG